MTLYRPSWDEAREAAHGTASLLSVEHVPLEVGVGRTLACDITARTPLPPRDVSAMDGWVVCGAPPWIVVGEIRAGMLPGGPLHAGQAMRIATGAVVPPRAVGVLRSEAGSIDASGRLWGDVTPGLAVRPAGEESREGELLVAAGTLLGPAHVGLIASAGHDEITAVRRPRAAILIFGDELLASGPARDGRVRDSLGPQLPGWLARLGVEVRDVRRVPDTLGDHITAIEDRDDVDLVVTTGGTAAGPVDHLHSAVKSAGLETVIDSVACRPGHPMLLAREPRRWLIGLPGNPQAAIVGLFTVAHPLVAGLLGRGLPPLDTAAATVSIPGAPGVTRLVPSTLCGAHATPTSHGGSGMLRGLAAADGFAIVGPSGCSAGEPVRFLTLA